MIAALKTVWPYMRRYRLSLVLGLIALVLKDLAGAVIPLILRKGVDTVTRGEPLVTLWWVCAAILGAALFKGVFMYFMRVILVGLSRDVEYDIRNDLFARLASLGHDYYGRSRTGDLMARATNDLNAVRMMLGPAMMYWAETSLTFVLAVGIMGAVDWRLTLWALSPTPLVSLVVVLFGRRIHFRFEKIQALFSDISSRVQENLNGARVLRAYVQDEAELERFAALNRKYIVQNMKLAKLSSAFMPLLQALIGLTFLVVLFEGGRRLIAGSLSLGSFVMFNTYMGTLIWPMIAFGWVVNLMERGTASLERIQQIMRERPSIQAPPDPLPPPASFDLSFENVAMDFPSEDGSRRALEGIDLEVPQGSVIAIVGRTGCGKSTLVNLIPRLFDPTEGRVTLAGAELRDYDPSDVRRVIGHVPQETFLFSATLAENIAFGVPGLSEDRIRRSAEMAGLGPDIEQFPNGLQTEVGERGLTLSGGQKQRAAIARAVARDPRVLILDDALSAVDTITEEKILASLLEFMRGRTTILISHRVSTVRLAERIYVLDEGRIVESGSHEQLLSTGGYYADLNQKQLLEAELESI